MLSSSQLSAITDFLRPYLHTTPQIGVILGTGLGEAVQNMTVLHTIPYANIPHFPQSTVAGHKGRLLIGEWGGVPLLVFQGRFHYYEGYSMQQVALPVYVMKLLGVQTLWVTNAAGGLNTDFSVGDLMLINDHISFFMPDNPLIGNQLEFINRFVDMRNAYTPKLLVQAETICQAQSISYQKGVYAVVQGAMLETNAEYRLLRMAGADAVGMSTVPEVITAAACGLEILGVAVITDMCTETAPTATLDNFLVVAQKSAKLMGVLFEGLFKTMNSR
jgi:purine-nucleoside phosphorylase